MTDKVISSVVLTPRSDGWHFRILFADGSSIESEQPYNSREGAIRAIDDALSNSQEGNRRITLGK
jgi:uncharacterized protein YegP (UPF0339 family)